MDIASTRAPEMIDELKRRGSTEIERPKDVLTVSERSGNAAHDALTLELKKMSSDWFLADYEARLTAPPELIGVENTRISWYPATNAISQAKIVYTALESDLDSYSKINLDLTRKIGRKPDEINAISGALQTTWKMTNGTSVVSVWIGSPRKSVIVAYNGTMAATTCNLAFGTAKAEEALKVKAIKTGPTAP